MAKTGTTALVPEKHDEYRDLCMAGLRDEELAVRYGFSWVTARKYRQLLAPETSIRRKKASLKATEQGGSAS